MTFYKCLLDPNLRKTELIPLSFVFNLLAQFPKVVFGVSPRAYYLLLTLTL